MMKDGGDEWQKTQQKDDDWKDARFHDDDKLDTAHAE